MSAITDQQGYLTHADNVSTRREAPPGHFHSPLIIRAESPER